MIIGINNIYWLWGICAGTAVLQPKMLNLEWFRTQGPITFYIVKMRSNNIPSPRYGAFKCTVCLRAENFAPTPFLHRIRTDGFTLALLRSTVIIDDAVNSLTTI